MAREARRIIRPATPEEKERHQKIRQQVESELPELKKWAKEAAVRQKDRVPVGTVFEADEAKVVQAIDDYAAKHDLQGRSAVVREALGQLLGIDVSRQ